jgi:short-subunit dehydrogenase
MSVYATSGSVRSTIAAARTAVPSIDMDLTGRTALVTGANRGIGRAVAEALADKPLRLVLAGVRKPEDFEPITGGVEVRPVRMDLASREAIEDSVTALGDDVAGVDLLVNNAGQMTGGLLEDQDMEAVYAMFQVNLVAVAHLTARLLPAMIAKGDGMVVNNASISGYASFPAATTYAASKAGVVALSESLRRELKGTGVGVLHVVTPGVNTTMLDATEEVYGKYMDTSAWDKVEPDAWASKIVAAVENDDHILGPGGKTALAKLASRGPAFLLDAFSDRMFSRQPRS